MTKIELLQGWNGNHAGTVLNMEMDGAAALLIQRGIARKIEEKPKKKIKLQDWVKPSEE